LKIFPYDELNFGRWNGNPFAIGQGYQGGDGHDEWEPTTWLLPYWLGRYYNFIE